MESEATALGWPNQSIGWSQIAKLSTGGWSAVGHAELTSSFGVFKFGHTRPDSTNSGLDAVIAENYAGSGEQHTLTLSDVKSSQTNEFVANVESSIIYYGDNSSQNSTGFFASKMFCNGPTYLSAAVMYENLVIEGNTDQITDNGKIRAAKRGLTEFVNLLGNLDGLGLTTFSDTINVQSPVQPLGPNRQKINDQIDAIVASGNTRLYDTIDEQVKALAALQTKHIKVIVVLTDGMDHTSDIKTSGTNAGDGIKVFTIAYGSDAGFSDLTQISSATGGQE